MKDFDLTVNCLFLLILVFILDWYRQGQFFQELLRTQRILRMYQTRPAEEHQSLILLLESHLFRLLWCIFSTPNNAYFWIYEIYPKLFGYIPPYILKRKILRTIVLILSEISSLFILFHVKVYSDKVVSWCLFLLCPDVFLELGGCYLARVLLKWCRT